jgi:hypothetical protein
VFLSSIILYAFLILLPLPTVNKVSENVFCEAVAKLERGWRVVPPPRAANWVAKLKFLNEEFDFLPSTYLKLLIQI